MKPKIGIDIVENERLEFKPNFLKKILTIKELEFLQNLESDERKQEFLAGRWAVKEAIFKVLPPEKNLPFNQIEISCTDTGPEILNSEFSQIVISLSHEKKYSVAVALNWGN